MNDNMICESLQITLDKWACTHYTVIQSIAGVTDG